MAVEPGLPEPSDVPLLSGLPEPADLPGVLLITGTDTEVGKTISTAALAAVLSGVGSVAVYKPVQTGVSGSEPGDAAEVARLSGIRDAVEGIRFRDPMAPVAAAEREQRKLPGIAEHAQRIEALGSRFDWVLVEGSGGVLVHLDDAGGTLADLPAVLAADCGAVVVSRAGLGTLNHTALTVAALASRGVARVGLVVGSLPGLPGLVESSNLRTLAAGREPLLAAIPAGAGGLDPAEFRNSAGSWFAGQLNSRL
ncbi:MAG: dethiobiotin synthase [Renibacterium sp.]|nr:dethiobiotin synthase [Renibacterium sp.]